MRYLCYLVVYCFCVVVIADTPPSCTTPNGETAQCISLFSCPILLQAISSQGLSVTKFIEASGCGNGQFMVCCGTSSNYYVDQTVDQTTTELGNINETATKESHREFVIKKLLPTKKFCGLQHTDDYVYNETVTSVDEFPWMLYIPLRAYDAPSVEQPENCTGFLINPFYALTSTDHSEKDLNFVEIGVYEKHQDVSCIATSFGVDDCTESIRVDIAEKHRAPGSNIWLLRLAKKISYTDYIRPICLPLEESDRPKLWDPLITSGWGEYNYRDNDVKIKKRVKHSVVKEESCFVHDSPDICIYHGRNATNYVCAGDNGGPLMYKHNSNWIAVGIVPYKENCVINVAFLALKLTPQILEWIFDNMRA